MNDQEAFAYHFRHLEERGLNGPVPDGWEHDADGHIASGGQLVLGWGRVDGEGLLAASSADPQPIDIDALAFAILRELTTTTAVSISPLGRNHPRTVTTPSGSVSEDSLLAALVKTYWKAQDAPSP